MSMRHQRPRRIQWLQPLLILGLACLAHAVAIGVAMLMWNSGRTDVSLSLSVPGALFLMNLIVLGLSASSPARDRRVSRCARLAGRRTNRGRGSSPA